MTEDEAIAWIVDNMDIERRDSDEGIYFSVNCSDLIPALVRLGSVE